jgi:fructokinase
MIVVGGEALIDLLVQPDGRISASPGGGPYNTARTIARLGSPVRFFGGLSTDGFGRRLRDGLTADGVRLDVAITTDRPTTLAVAELDAGGTASYRFYTERTSATALDRSHLPDLESDHIDAIHVGTLGLVLEPLAEAMEALVAGAPKGAVVMIDVNARPSATSDLAGYARRIDRMLDRADVLKASTDDLAAIRPNLSSGDAVRDLLDRGARVVLWTDGAGPVRIITAAGRAEVQPPGVAVVDTVGAGDALGGGFLATWVAPGRGRAELAAPGPEEALVEATRRAVRVASFTCTRAGADPPTAAELAAWAPA